MSKKQQSERTEFVIIMVEELKSNRVVGLRGLLGDLMFLAKRHGMLQERVCNGHQTVKGDWDEEAANRDQKREEAIEARITAICEKLGCKPIFSGDPRGATVKVIVPSGRSNSWGGEGICVPQ